jgi:tetratricopeptide (TPR) repeat protein
MFAVEKDLEPTSVEWFEKTLRNAPAKPPALAAAHPPTPIEEFWGLIEVSGGATRAATFYEEAKKRDPKVFLFPEAAVNALGYQRLQDGEAEEAVEIFKINVAAYPGSANVYDSLGDAYVAVGNRELAIQASRKTLEVLDATPIIEPELRKLLRESAETKLKKLGAPIASPQKP